jgi:hypothetical protein
LYEGGDPTEWAGKMSGYRELTGDLVAAGLSIEASTVSTKDHQVYRLSASRRW